MRPQGFVWIKKIENSKLCMHKKEDVEGKVFAYLEESVDKTGYLVVVSHNGETTGLEIIEKSDTMQDENILKILRSAFELRNKDNLRTFFGVDLNL